MYTHMRYIQSTVFYSDFLYGSFSFLIDLQIFSPEALRCHFISMLPEFPFYMGMCFFVLLHDPVFSPKNTGKPFFVHFTVRSGFHFQIHNQQFSFEEIQVRKIKPVISHRNDLFFQQTGWPEMSVISASVQNSKASKFDGNIKRIGFHLGMKALNNIYLDFYDSNNSKTSCS